MTMHMTLYNTKGRFLHSEKSVLNTKKSNYRWITSSGCNHLEHVLHVVVHLPEAWAFGGLPLPTLPHEGIDTGGAPGWTLHPVPTLQQLKF